MQEHEAPIAHRRPFAQLQTDGLRVVEGQFETGGELGLGAVHLFGGGRRFRQAVQGGQHRRLGLGQRILFAHLGAHQHRARFAQLKREHRGGRREAGLHHVFVEAAGGLGVEQVGKHLHCRELLVRTGRHMVDGHQQLRVAHAPQSDRTFAILRGFRRVGGEQGVGAGALGTGDGAEGFFDHGHRALLVETAGHHQHGVVRLVVLAVEALQSLDGHVLDVRARPDGGVAVVVPQVGGGHHPTHQHARRTVLAALPLVAHDGHLGGQILRGDERIDHPVGFQFQRPAQVVLAGREGLEVVGAIEPCGAVGEGAAFGQFVVDVGVVRGAFEDEVLQQVRHAGFAVAFVPGAHQIGDVHGDLLLALVRKEQDAQTVRQLVFRNTLHGGHHLGLRCRRGGGRGQAAGGTKRTQQRHRNPSCQASVRVHLNRHPIILR